MSEKTSSNLVDLELFKNSKTAEGHSGNAIESMSRRIKSLKDEKCRLIQSITLSLLEILKLKDENTYEHSIRVAEFCVLMGQELNLSEKEMTILEVSALLHDIGKVGVPDSVISKPTRLTDKEFKIVQNHSGMAYDILGHIEGFDEVANTVRYHHERYDGRGYPAGLKGQDIPKFSRIIHIVDAYDSLTSYKHYRKGLPSDIALNELLEFSGTQFDPGLVKKFIEVLKSFEELNKAA